MTECIQKEVGHVECPWAPPTGQSRRCRAPWLPGSDPSRGGQHQEKRPGPREARPLGPLASAPTQVWVEPRLDRTALRCSRHQAAPHLPSPQTLSTGRQAEECPRHSLGHQDFFSKPRDFKTWGPLGVLFYVFPRQRRPLLPRLLTESYVQRPTC